MSKVFKVIIGIIAAIIIVVGALVAIGKYADTSAKPSQTAAKVPADFKLIPQHTVFTIAPFQVKGGAGPMEIPDNPAPEGSEYVLAGIEFSNSTEAPVGPEVRPQMALISPAGTVYPPDLIATSQMLLLLADKAPELKFGMQLSYNPGVKYHDVAMFLVNTKMYETGVWAVGVKTPQATALISTAK